MGRTGLNGEAVDAILKLVINRTRGIIYSAAYLETAFENQIADDVADLQGCRPAVLADYDPDLGKAAAEMRAKTAFVRWAVEEAVRQGRAARDILAESFPP